MRLSRGVISIAVLTCGFLAFTACDRWDGLTVRNDADEPLRVVWQLPGGPEQPVDPIPAAQPGLAPSSLAPGALADAGFISGPPDPRPDIIVKAFNSGGTLVYCRRITPSEYSAMTNDHPLSLKPDQVRCE